MSEVDPGGLIDAFLVFKEHNEGRSPRTAAKYRGYLLRWLSYCAGLKSPIDPLQAGREQLEAFTGLVMHTAGLSPRSRRAVVAALKGFYAWLARERHIDADPACSVPYPLAGLKLPTPMALKQAEKLLMAPDITTFTGIRDAAMLGLLIGCGLRISGLCSLNESSLIFVLDDDWERLIVKVTEKGNKERLVPAPDEARLLIRAYLGHSELDEIDRALPNGDRVLFASVRNRMVTADKYHGEARRMAVRSVNDMIVAHGLAAGLQRAQLHPHAMRHLFGTELAEHDVDVLVRQALMGHADPKSTEIYTHLAMRKLAKVIDRANPLGRIKTPVTDLLQKLKPRAQTSSSGNR